MNSSIIRKLIGDNYDYEIITNTFSEKEINNYKSSISHQFSILTKKWNDNLHSEWTARMFLGAKMIYSSTLLLNTLAYSKRKNITITEPYLLYYSLFNCCRALTFALPTQLWNKGEILYDTHSKIINVSSDAIKRLSRDVGKHIFHLLTLSKDYRELFSYRFPADGLNKDELFKEINLENIAYQCSLICEIAQMNSEVFENVIEFPISLEK